MFIFSLQSSATGNKFHSWTSWRTMVAGWCCGCSSLAITPFWLPANTVNLRRSEWYTLRELFSEDLEYNTHKQSMANYAEERKPMAKFWMPTFPPFVDNLATSSIGSGGVHQEERTNHVLMRFQLLDSRKWKIHTRN